MKTLLAAVLALGICAGAQADDTARGSIGESELIAGGDIVMDEPVDGNAFAAGGKVTIQERIERSAFVSGGDVTISGSIGRNLYAAGGDLRFEGEVEGDARMAGGTLRIAPGARIHGDASLAGGSVEVGGMIGADLRAYGESIDINGMVAGDVEAAGDSIRLGPDAQIGGRIVYRSDGDIIVDPAARIGGEVVKARSDRELRRKLGRGASIAGGVVVSIGMVLLGAVLILGMPRFSREAAANVRGKPWHSIGLGCVMLLAVPFVIVVLMITLVGIPLALLIVFGYVALLLLGFLVGAIFLGDFALERMDAAKLASVWWRALFLVLALVVVALVKQVPVVGDIAWWILFLAGLGAFTMRAWQGFKDQPVVA
jgi:cytoskeletal protein CcmA (bactofilin family)